MPETLAVACLNINVTLYIHSRCMAVRLFFL